MSDSPGGFNDAADHFVDDLAARNARHKREEAVAYATVTQLAEVSQRVEAAQGDIKDLKDTIQGRVDGVHRVPGLIDIVSDQGETMKAIKNVLYAIFVVLAGNIAVAIGQHYGIFK